MLLKLLLMTSLRPIFQVHYLNQVVKSAEYYVNINV